MSSYWWCIFSCLQCCVSNIFSRESSYTMKSYERVSLIIKNQNRNKSHLYNEELWTSVLLQCTFPYILRRGWHLPWFRPLFRANLVTFLSQSHYELSTFIPPKDLFSSMYDIFLMDWKWSFMQKSSTCWLYVYFQISQSHIA